MNITGTSGNDNLVGGAGNDTLYGSWGNDTLDGGAGVDTVDYSTITPGAGVINANLATGVVQKVLSGGTVANVGTTGRYIRIYHTGMHTAYGLSLTGMKVYAGGVDVAAGRLTMIGIDGFGYGGDVLNNPAALTDAAVGGGWNGASGDNSNLAYVGTYGFGFIELDLGRSQVIDSIALWGCAGWSAESNNLRVYVSNTAFSASATAYTDLATSSTARFDMGVVETNPVATYTYTDTVTGIENVTGTAMNDTLTGDANANTLSGGAGNDTLNGGAGNDTLNGGTDNDTLNGGTGNDTLDGGAGVDTADYSTTPGAGGINANLAAGTVSKILAGTAVNVRTTGRYIRIYHTDAIAANSILSLTGMKVYVGGVDVAAGRLSVAGADSGYGSSQYNNAAALTDATVGGTWNGGPATGPSNLAYVSSGSKGYIELDLGSSPLIDSIALWGRMDASAESNNLRVYVSNTPFVSSATAYTDLWASSAVTRLDIAVVDTSATTTWTDTVTGIENVIGTAMNDTITGDANNNVLSGGAGNDILYGGEGVDTVDYSVTPGVGRINANLATGMVTQVLAGTAANVDTMGRYIRIYHTDAVAANATLSLTGLKVYVGGVDVAAGKASTAGADSGYGASQYNNAAALTDATVGGFWNTGSSTSTSNLAYVSSGSKGYIELDLGSSPVIDSIALWGRADASAESNNLRVYVSNTAFASSPTAYTDLAASSTARFDMGVVETSAATTYIGTVTGIENVVGTAMNDTITGDGNANMLSGGAGNDTLDGGAGNDTLNGGAGVDTVDYSTTPGAGRIDANLATGTVTKVLAGTVVGQTGRYIRIYHRDSVAANATLSLTGMKVYVGGVDVAAGRLSVAGADSGYASGGSQYNNAVALTDGAVGGFWNAGSSTSTSNLAYVSSGSKGYIELDLGSSPVIGSIALWGRADASAESNNLRVYVSNTAFASSPTAYADLEASSTARFDMGVVETNPVTAYTDTVTGIENVVGTAMNDTITGDGNANTLSGGAGNDTLYGGTGNDTLSGGAGNDTLIGGAGSDTYTFARGDGADLMQENSWESGNNDILQFLSGVSSDQLWLRYVNNDLEVSVIGTSDKVTVSNWYSGSAYRVEQIKAGDGKVLQDSSVDNLVQAMAGFAPPSAGQTTLPANYQTALAPVLAANWH